MKPQDACLRQREQWVLQQPVMTETHFNLGVLPVANDSAFVVVVAIVIVVMSRYILSKNHIKIRIKLHV